MPPDAGPLDLVDPSALAPLPDPPNFAGLVAGQLGNVPGLDVALVSAHTDLANAGVAPADGFDAALSDAIGDGLDAPGATITNDGADLSAHGDGLDQVRQSVLDLLPPPETPATFDYVEPPAPPREFTPPGDRAPAPDVPTEAP